MITRRDALKVAAFIGAGRAVHPTLRSAEAAVLLDEPAEGMDESTINDEPSAFSPAEFADNAVSRLLGPFEDLVFACCARERAQYEQARSAYARSLPDLPDDGFETPWSLFSEVSMGLQSALFAAGLRMGAEFEHLRIAMLEPDLQCSKCWGCGSLSPSGGPDYGYTDSAVCDGCGGSGYIPTPGVRARAINSQ